MSPGGDSWMKEFDEAVKMTDNINAKIAERNEMVRHGEDTSRLVAATRRKINMLSTLADRLQSLLKSQSETQPKAKELRKREDMLFGLRYKVKQMTSALSTTQPSLRDKLLDKDKRAPAAETERTVDLDNRGVIQMQQDVMTEQDEQLRGLESTVTTTKHIALAINGELDLHSRLLDELDADVESTNSRFMNTQKKLTTITKRANKTCNLIYIFLVIVGLLIVLLVLVKLSKFF